MTDELERLREENAVLQKYADAKDLAYRDVMLNNSRLRAALAYSEQEYIKAANENDRLRAELREHCSCLAPGHRCGVCQFLDGLEATDAK